MNYTDDSVYLSDPIAVVPEAEPVAEVAPVAGDAVGVLSLRGDFAKSPTGKPIHRRYTHTNILYAYAVETGGHIDLTPEVLALLESRGLPATAITQAVFFLRNHFGKDIKSIRTGRKVTALGITL